MIDEKKLEKYKIWLIDTYEKWNGQKLERNMREIYYPEVKEIVDTLEALWKVARAAEKVYGMAKTYDERVQDMGALGVSLAALHEPSEKGKA